MTAYPGRIIKRGDPDKAIVKAVQIALIAHGCGPLAESGVFDAKTEAAVKLFTKAGTRGIPRVMAGKAVQNPALVQPGQIFVIDTGGVFRRESRKIAQINR
jgi:hypothetical protein